MAASSVNVFSRRFDKGLEGFRCLSFENGLSLRPTLTGRKPVDVGMNVSTRVQLTLKADLALNPDQIEIRCNVAGHRNIYVPFVSYVSALVSGIDVPVSVDTNGTCKLVHEGFPPKPGKQTDWLQTLSYVSAGVNQPGAALVGAVTPRLREIRDGNTCYGLAAISVARGRPCDFLAAKSVGGFVAHDTGHSFVGLIDHLPNSAKREPGEIAAPRKILEAWLSEQVALLKGQLSPVESILASYSLCHFDYDPIDVLQAILVVIPVSL